MKRRGRKEKAVREFPRAEPSSLLYEVDMTDSAAAVFSDLFRRARAAENRGDPSNAVCTTFRMVQEAIKTIIPADPLNPRYALSGDLSNIFRIHKGRLRICWIASSKMKRVCILFISESLRKEGDVNDPYRVFARMVRSGELDAFFARLGVKKPG